uniref:WAT1-related protein n=1 Tax=Kalanchoe fedtschenkoi TaxID=63787 RepID=A0A7N0RFF9_KALFE
MLGKFFILGFFEITLVRNFAFAGLNFSSPTLSSAMSNMEPALTFLLAVIFSALTGSLNTIPSISNWVIGGSCFAVSALFVSVSNILLASVLKEYPSEISVILFYSLFGTLQCAVISLIAESDLNAWKLRPGIELMSVLCTAVGGTVLHSGILAWCLVKKGPVFVAMFCPLGAVIAAVMSVIFLGDTLHIGSSVFSDTVLCGIIIVSGFYAVIWAKSIDKEKDEQGTHQSPSSQTIPLLLDH